MEEPLENSYRNADELPSVKESQKALLQKEHDLNTEEQLLLKKRIAAQKEKMKVIGRTDPEYGLMKMEIDKDQIFLDELTVREIELRGLLEPT